MRNGRSAASDAHAGNSWKNSTGRRSSPCRSSPTCSPNGACAASASTITSTSIITSTAFPTALPAPKSRCASPHAPWRSSPGASGSPLMYDRAATTSTRPSPNTCHPATGAMPTAPSIVFARKRPASGRRLLRCANSSWSAGPIPSRASAPVAASCALCARSAASGSKPPRRALSTSAGSATDRSAPSSTTSSTGRLRTSVPRTACRSSTPTSAAHATTIRRSTLLTHPTLDLLRQLGLNGMAKAFSEIEASNEAATLSHPEWLGLLLDREATWRHDRRLTARLRYARLRHQAAIEDVDYKASRGLDRALFNKLAEGSWIDAHDNVILCGPTGVGKSWLASALGHKACRDNRSVLYQRIPKLFADLALARGDGRYARILRALGGVQLLILDDWGLAPLDAAARQDLYEILEERHGRRSTILTSQIPVDKWHTFIGDPTYAAALLDRLVHNAHRIDLAGESLRRKRSRSIAKD